MTFASSRIVARAALVSTALVAGLWIAAPVTAFAFDRSSSAPVNLSAGDLAVHGYDPVAYFRAGAPTEGSPEFTAEHGGALYRFASAANRAAFIADPAAFAPAYGGFCAFGLVYGQKVDVDPEAFRIVDGTLYLNVDKSVRDRWDDKRASFIAEANGNWPRIKHVAPDDL